jgi:N-acetylglucosaminyldiphosphoundecaprenol N-acetyl-beta-D-mannosaminyltransferase
MSGGIIRARFAGLSTHTSDPAHGRHLLMASTGGRATPATAFGDHQATSDHEPACVRPADSPYVVVRTEISDSIVERSSTDEVMPVTERRLAYAAPTEGQGDTILTECMLIGGIPTLRANRQQLAARMVADCALARSGQLAKPRVLTSSNGSVIANFRRDAAFRDLIMKADGVDADGQPLVIASRLFCKTPLPERIATTDFIHDAAEAAAANGLRFYFLGARPGVAEVAADHLRAFHPGLRIAGVRDGYFSPDQEDQICRDIVRLGVDVLWVGLGSPAQESFAIRNREKLAGLAWIKTCGGLFDHYSGQCSRAPMWMQKAGLEWLYRAIKEPRRLGPRYLITNLPALYQLITATSDGPVLPTPGVVPV